MRRKPIKGKKENVKVDNMTQKEIIKDYFDDKFDLFLKRYYRMNRAYPIHSRLVPEWNEDRKKRRAIRWLYKKLEYPEQRRQVINLLRTLEKYYDAQITRKDMEFAYNIWVLFTKVISTFFSKQWQKTVRRRRWDKVKKLTKKQAWAEQKAIGYIPQEEWEDYDPQAAHVYSNIKRNYLYPENFYHGGCMKYANKTHIYIGLGYVGVGGYSRSVIPT